MPAASNQALCPGCFEDSSGVSVCPHCGYNKDLKRHSQVLGHDVLLNHGQYLIGKVLGKGDFGITYLAYDTRLQTRVAIKEYLPANLSGRETDHITVSAHSGVDDENFHYGLDQFVKEARTLAKIDHSNIVKVKNLFEGNGTAYMVMDYYNGLTLAEFLEQKGGKLSEELAVGIFMPILDGLHEVHDKKFIHRDIKPQNIYLTSGNRPVLINFGSARLALRERSQSLSIVVNPGYAPLEQYQSHGDQGPWTDIYASAAVIYQLVTGILPPAAADRVPNDTLEAPERYGISKALSRALVAGLAVHLDGRPKNVRQFQSLLTRKLTDAVPVPQEPPIQQVMPTQQGDTEAFNSHQKPAEQGNAFGQHKLGVRHPLGKGVPQSDTEAANCIRKAAKQRNDAAQIQPSRMVFPAIQPNQNMANEIEQIPVQCKGIRPWKWMLAIIMLVFTIFEIREMLSDIDILDNRGVYSIRKAAEQGDAKAQNNLGVMHLNGKGVPQSDAEAVELFKKAANQGNAKAQYNLGVMHLNGKGVPQSDAEAAGLFKKASVQGDADAQFILGTMHFEGKGVPQSDTEAVELFKKAADQGNADAQNNLGLMYREGKGVPQSDTEAVELFKKAAERGNASAQYNLGAMHLNGRGVPQSDAEAADLFKKAAEQGDEDAIKILKFFKK